MTGERTVDRTILRISGTDRASFLQGLVTNDLNRLKDGLLYAALLTPQGKYLADFFLLEHGDSILLDVASDLAPGLLRRLAMYRLRAAVEIAPSDMRVTRGLGAPPADAVADPRHAALGWRLYGASGGPPEIDWDRVRVEATIPETGIELIPDESYILEMGFDRLHGVDFRKGCYVGQEVTARMRHKTQLRKGLVRVAVAGTVPVGTEIVAAGKPAGTLYTQSGGAGLAHLRLDRAGPDMQAGAARVLLETV